MGVKYLWDTNVVVYYLQQQFPLASEKLIDDLLKESPPCISAITEIELLCWKTPTEKDTKMLNGFISDSLIIELDRPIKLATAAIRKIHKIKLPDAIIAATALEYRYTLITRNVSDFMNIKGLKVLNPWDVK